MTHLKNTRGIVSLAVAAAVGFGAGRPTPKAASIDTVLRAAVDGGDVPGVVAMVASADKVLYRGAFGKAEVGSGQPMTEDTIFRIYSMTKPVTSVAAMQLVEQGKLKLDEPAGKYLPELQSPQVLTGFREGEPQLKPASNAVTVKHLLTHTSGLAYPFWSAELRDYRTKVKDGPPPLVFEPGERWLYGTNTDSLGKVVEAVSGLTLDEYFRRNIFEPLGMRSTFFNVPEDQAKRMATTHARQGDGTLRENAPQPLKPVTSFGGGGGLYSTAGDYVKFMQMILHQGASGKARVLQAKTVAAMSTNQIGSIEAGRLKSAMPAVSNDVDFHPGSSDRWGLGFLINPVAYEGGRGRGSLAWAGALNTFFWIDPENQLCAVILVQIVPFCDHKSVALLREFEKAVYATARR